MLYINRIIEVSFWFVPISRDITIRNIRKCVYNTAQKLWLGPWPTFFPGNVRHVLPGIASFAYPKFGLDQWDEMRARVSSKRVKITLLFLQRYLENRKSYQDNSESVLKSKVLRVRRTLIGSLKFITFEVIAVQSFLNFNIPFNQICKK